MEKVVFLDVDGTLVDYHNRIPNSAITAIRQARKNGHKIFICTGRSRAEVQPDIWDIGIDGMIGGNGSFIENNGEVIMHQLISKKESKHIVDWLTQRGLPFYLESNNGLFASPNFRELARDTLREYSLSKGKTAKEVKDQEVEDVIHGIIFDENLYRDDLNKVSFVLSDYQDHLDSIEEFPDLEAHTWGGRGEKALFGDLGVKNIDKAYAIDVLLKHIGCKLDDTIAFGDAKIDIPMLKYCAYGVAMGNGGPEILKIADMITDDIEEDGIYNAFKKLQLI